MTQATPRSRRGPAGTRARSRRPRRSAENSDVLVSAVISTYLLTHLHHVLHCLLYTSPSPRDRQKSRMPSSA